jgi:glutamyl-tRNA reductase
VTIILLGQNHQTAPVEMREKLAFTPSKLQQASDLLASDDLLQEGVVLSTCNRAEIYAVTAEPEAGGQRLGSLLERVHGVPLSNLNGSLYRMVEEQAVRHLFRVSSGLDSMVLGEGQILAQVKGAHAWAKDHSLAHEVLHRLFHQAAACGKQVRHDTAIGEGAVSIAFAAVSLARHIFRDLNKETVLLLGAGETGRKVARQFQQYGVQDLRISNRTLERAEELAKELTATIVPWELFEKHLPEASVVVTATASVEPILRQEHVRTALANRGRRPLFLIDVSVPRNIDNDAKKLPGVFLYNIDNLRGIVDERRDQRTKEAQKGERIVEEQVEQFLEWYRGRAAAPTLTQIRDRIEAVRQSELAAARARLTPEAFDELDRVTRRLINKILHTPTVQLKRRVAHTDEQQLLEQIRDLFGLDDEPPKQ